MTNTLEHNTNHQPIVHEQIITTVVDLETLEQEEQDRLRIIGTAILAQTIELDTRRDPAVKTPPTPVEKIPRVPESFAY